MIGRWSFGKSRLPRLLCGRMGFALHLSWPSLAQAPSHPTRVARLLQEELFDTFLDNVYAA